MPMPMYRSYAASTSNNGKLIFYGGLAVNGSNYYFVFNDMWELDVAQLLLGESKFPIIQKK